MTDKTKQKIRDYWIKKWQDPQHRKVMKKANAKKWSNPEIGRKISLSRIGKSMSFCTDRTKQKRRENQIKRWKDPEYRKKQLMAIKMGVNKAEVKAKRIGQNNPRYGIKRPKEIGIKISLANMGREVSKETRKKISDAGIKRCKEGTHNWWKGGITPENFAFRGKAKYMDWRKEVFTRDDYTCQKCNERGGNLHAHHIKSFSQYSDLRLDIDNGITLCKKCHREFHKENGYSNLPIIKLVNI